MLKGFDFEEAGFRSRPRRCSGQGAARSTSGTTGRSSRARSLGRPGHRVDRRVRRRDRHSDSPNLLARETADLLFWRQGPVAFGDDVAWLPFAVGIGALAGLLALAYLVFRPLSPPVETDRELADELVREHGRDTLAFFKLRRDKQYLFGPTGARSPATGSREGVMLLSGDPVGTPTR